MSTVAETKDMEFLGAGVIGSFELPDEGLEN